MGCSTVGCSWSQNLRCLLLCRHRCCWCHSYCSTCLQRRSQYLRWFRSTSNCWSCRWHYNENTPNSSNCKLISLDSRSLEQHSPCPVVPRLPRRSWSGRHWRPVQSIQSWRYSYIQSRFQIIPICHCTIPSLFNHNNRFQLFTDWLNCK